MRSLALVSALSASLALNVVLGFSLLLRRQGCAVSARVVGAGLADGDGVSALKAGSIKAQMTELSSQGPRQILSAFAWMKAQGFTALEARAALEEILRIRLRRAHSEILSHKPFWISALTAEEAAELRKIEALQKRVFDSLSAEVGQDTYMTAQEIHRSFGSIPPEKISNLIRIQTDYAQIKKDFSARQDILGQEKVTLFAQLEAEEMRDTARLLSPAELNEFNLRNSLRSRKLIESLNDISVNESQFTMLYNAAGDREKAKAMDGSQSVISRADNVFFAVAESTMSSGDFPKFLKNVDDKYAAVLFLSDSLKITPRSAYQIATIQRKSESGDISRLEAASQVKNFLGADELERFKKLPEGSWLIEK